MNTIVIAAIVIIVMVVVILIFNNGISIFPDFMEGQTECSSRQGKCIDVSTKCNGVPFPELGCEEDTKCCIDRNS
jgi:hypothetical protein